MGRATVAVAAGAPMNCDRENSFRRRGRKIPRSLALQFFEVCEEWQETAGNPKCHQMRLFRLEDLRVPPRWSAVSSSF